VVDGFFPADVDLVHGVVVGVLAYFTLEGVLDPVEIDYRVARYVVDVVLQLVEVVAGCDDDTGPVLPAGK
jgi:hypothetical protein